MEEDFSENENEFSGGYSSECSSEYDVYDILDREMTPKEKLVGTIKSIQLMIDTQPMSSLMRDDVDFHEYNRSYNYYYKDEYNKKYDDVSSSDTFRMNYESKLIEINTMIKNIIKISREETNDEIIDCIDYMLQSFVIDVLDKINYYNLTGKENCLYKMNNLSAKILHSFNSYKTNKLQECYKHELERNGRIEKKSFMYRFLNY